MMIACSMFGICVGCIIMIYCLMMMQKKEKEMEQLRESVLAHKRRDSKSVLVLNLTLDRLHPSLPHLQDNRRSRHVVHPTAVHLARSRLLPSRSSIHHTRFSRSDVRFL